VPPFLKRYPTTQNHIDYLYKQLERTNDRITELEAKLQEQLHDRGTAKVR
jgi:chaperonin cofactor prefoldin